MCFFVLFFTIGFVCFFTMIKNRHHALCLFNCVYLFLLFHFCFVLLFVSTF